MSNKEIKFPEEFLWGTAVCSHQAEGFNEHSDWWEWEQRGKTKDGTVSGPAADMYNRYPEDLAFMKEIGLGAFRLGIAWARIEPRRGEYDEEAFQHYADVFAEMKKCGLKVCLTLYHWVLPKWVADAGGWESPDSVRWFRRFCRRVIDRFFDDVDMWVTLNEPMVPVIAGYVAGEFPPEKRDPLAARKVFRNLLRGHLEAYQIIKMKAKEKKVTLPPVGIAMATADVTPGKIPGIVGEKIADIARNISNTAFLDAMQTGRIPFPFGFNEAFHGLAGSYNYMGLNYYTRMRLKVPTKIPTDTSDFCYIPEGTETTEMGYEVYPPGFYNVLMEINKYEVPIYITENGIADETDSQRPSYILRHLAQVHRARENGADIRGYFHWSYIDNFEWKEGFAKHFGLVALEPDTLNRKPRPSAYMYGDIAKSGRITEEMVNKYAPEAAQQVWNPADYQE